MNNFLSENDQTKLIFLNTTDSRLKSSHEKTREKSKRSNEVTSVICREDVSEDGKKTKISNQKAQKEQFEGEKQGQLEEITLTKQIIQLGPQKQPRQPRQQQPRQEQPRQQKQQGAKKTQSKQQKEQPNQLEQNLTILRDCDPMNKNLTEHDILTSEKSLVASISGSKNDEGVINSEQLKDILSSESPACLFAEEVHLDILLSMLPKFISDFLNDSKNKAIRDTLVEIMLDVGRTVVFVTSEKTCDDYRQRYFVDFQLSYEEEEAQKLRQKGQHPTNMKETYYGDLKHGNNTKTKRNILQVNKRAEVLLEGDEILHDAYEKNKRYNSTKSTEQNNNIEVISEKAQHDGNLDENGNPCRNDATTWKFLKNSGFNDVVTIELLENIVHSVSKNKNDRRFGQDNRCGIDGTLHRISRKVNRSNRTIGMTLRVGRAVTGLSTLLHKELKAKKSILLVGKPGSGKTTLLRDCAYYLGSLGGSVEIVDTSNEVAGDGNIPNSSIGNCRRIMVSQRQKQHEIMLEAVQNHGPDSLVIDEIGTVQEATAVRDISQRGVQLLGTAHGGSIKDIMDSPTLARLVGEIHSVILSGREMERRITNSTEKESRKPSENIATGSSIINGTSSSSTMSNSTNQRKTVRERVFNSPFDILVEVKQPGTVAVYENLNTIVDSALNGIPVPVSIRSLQQQKEAKRDVCDTVNGTAIQVVNSRIVFMKL